MAQRGTSQYMNNTKYKNYTVHLMYLHIFLHDLAQQYVYLTKSRNLR